MHSGTNLGILKEFLVVQCFVVQPLRRIQHLLFLSRLGVDPALTDLQRAAQRANTLGF